MIHKVMFWIGYTIFAYIMLVEAIHVLTYIVEGR